MKLKFVRRIKSSDLGEVQVGLSGAIADQAIKVKEYSTSFLSGKVIVRRIGKIIYIDANTTAAIYCNPAIKHTLVTLDGIYIPIDSIYVTPINNGGNTAYVSAESGRLTMTLNTAIDVGGAVCIHAVFIAK